MSKIDGLISELSSQAAPRSRPARPGRLVGLWLAGILVYISAIFATGICSVPPDLGAFLQQPLFAAEIAALALMIVASLVALAVLAFPDRYQKPGWIYAPAGALGIFIGVMAMAWMSSANAEDIDWDGAQCLLCITSLSLLPAVLMLVAVKRMATVNPDQAGFLAALCAFGVGALILRLSEANSSLAHVVVWHYAPMLVISLVGLWLGPRVLKW